MFNILVNLLSICISISIYTDWNLPEAGIIALVNAVALIAQFVSLKYGTAIKYWFYKRRKAAEKKTQQDNH